MVVVASCSQAISPEPENAARGPVTATNDGLGASGVPAANDEQDGTTSIEPRYESEQSALAIFERRIIPIFQSQKPSSCSECHLSGVDLRDYIHPDQEKTFASLVAAKLVNVDEPDKSKILEFISRKPEKPNLITEKVRQQECDAFRAWLRAAVNDRRLLAARPAERALGPTVPEIVIRHARSDRILASFIDNVWTEVSRCAHCHSPDRNLKQVEEHGEQVSWIKLGDPEATMRYMLDAGLIDAESPEESLLLLKPTMQVKHGGGQKVVVGDRTYKQFRRFIDDYAATAAGKYKSVEDLPQEDKEVSVISEAWFKITDVPARFDKMLLQVDLFRWEDGHWSEDRWATADRQVFGPGKLWQQTLSLTAPRSSPRAAEIRAVQALPPGRYLAKIYLDARGRLQKDFRAEMGVEEFVGEVEVESKWPVAYDQMTAISFPPP
jgi:hypothetical protein